MNSIWQTFNEQVLRRINCVKKYQGNNSREPSSIEHMSTSACIGLLSVILTLSISKWFYLVGFVGILFYSVFVELVLDRKKNKGREFGNVLAQILERSVAGLIVLILFGWGVI